jgi:hypothetical protein
LIINKSINYKFTWPEKFLVTESQQLLDERLFGPGTAMPDNHNRISDITLLARDNNYLWWSDEEKPLTGRHSGLSAMDMIVSFVAIPL